jgi:dihydroorotate dehydrogenase
LGFGFAEIGTVTYRPQEGNPQPRLFRYPQQEAVINRMGFNNEGALAVGRRLARYRPVQGCPLGVNIGKSRIIDANDVEAVITDYVASFRTLAPYADYITLNVSSPNTPGLRQLQQASTLRPLLAALQAANQDLVTQQGKLPVPLLLKVDPDLDYPALDALLDVVHEQGIAGLVATNTTVQRPAPFSASCAASTDANPSGGLSGAPLFPLALQRVRYVAQVTQGRLPIVASGGICNANQASQMLDAGATLIQIYTGLIYQGPGLVRTLVHGLKGRYGPWV